MPAITSQKARQRATKDLDLIERQIAEVEVQRAAKNASFDDMVKMVRDQAADIEAAIKDYDTAHSEPGQVTIPIREAV